MNTKAAIINGDFIVFQEISRIYEGQIKVNCNAIFKCFMASRQSEVEGGTLYTTGCPDLTAAGMIIAAKLGKIVYNEEPVDSDELCALELLKDNNIAVIYNPKLIF